MRRALLILLVAAPAAAAPDPRLAVRDAMVAELERSMERLRLDKFEAPYFIAYTVRDNEVVNLAARYGAVFVDERTHNRQAYVEVRVGDYLFDNTASAGSAGDAAPADEIYEPAPDTAVDDDADALRGTLWLLTDARYKSALAALNQRRGVRATTVVDDESLPSFSRAAPVAHVDAPAPLSVDRDAWARRLRTASAAVKRHPAIFDSEIRLQIRHQTRYLANSEGSRLVTERTIWALHLQAVTRASDGVLIEHGRSFYGAAEADLLDEARLTAELERLAADLERLRDAPILDPYTGPALLLPEATGVLFHEVIGHRLEGERLGDDQEGQTFKGQIGKPVIPAFLDVLDDPTQRAAAGVSLNGFYEFDEEGVPAQPVTLIEKGVLKSYLTSRKPVAGVLASNGHGRADGNVDPIARMGVTVVRSRKTVGYDQLKAMLLDEVRRQGKPFGLILRDITGGSTNTASFGYQAFKGTPRMVYKVDAKTGAETLVRGVEMVGTPLTSINKIIAASDKPGVFNGYCGAESGFVPVSTLAPAVLLTEIELQRAQRVRQKQTVLPPPWQR